MTGRAATARIAAAAALAAALLCSGCTASAGGDRPPGARPAATPSYTPASAPVAPTVGASTRRMTPQPSMTQTSAARPGPPGGSGDTAALIAAGDLTDDGRIKLRRPTDATATAGSGADLCGFLFGSPGEVADSAGLTGDVTLDPISGRHLLHAADADSGDAATTMSGSADPDAASAAVIACVYRSAGEPVLALQVGDGPPVDPDLPGHPTIVDLGGLHAVLSYSPDHPGATIDPAKARAWLSAAIRRVARSGTG